MVATNGRVEMSIPDFVQGKRAIDPATIPAPVFFQLIWDTVVGLKLLKRSSRFMSIKKLLEAGRVATCQIERIIDPRVITHKEKGNPNPANTYALLHGTDPFARSWGEESRKPVQSQHVVISPVNDLFVLTTDWNAREERDPVGVRKTVTKFWYEARLILMQDQHQLIGYLERNPAAGSAILNALHTIVSDVERSLKLEYDTGTSQRRQLKEQLRRLNLRS